MNKPTGISKLWSKLAKETLGGPEGRHCHWCKYIAFKDTFRLMCKHDDTPYQTPHYPGTWDGSVCAEKCIYFELNEWYKDDENFKKAFNLVHAGEDK